MRNIGKDKATNSAKPMSRVTSSPVKKVTLKSNFNGKSKKRVPQTGLGPGNYDPDTAQKATHARAKTALIGGGKTGRPDINKRI